MDHEYLERIVNCPSCKNPVKYGDMIWKDGNCFCPDCYAHFMHKYYDVDVNKIK